MILVFLKVTEEENAVNGIMILYPSSNAPGVVFHSAQIMCTIGRMGIIHNEEKGSRTTRRANAMEEK